MLYGLLALLLAQQAELEQPVDMYPFVTVPMAATDVNLWDTPIQMCGHVVPSPQSGESLMHGRDKWLYVDTGRLPPLKVGSAACVPGVVRRRDGLTYKEAMARKLGFHSLSHLPNPDLVFRLCNDPKSCNALVPVSARTK